MTGEVNDLVRTTTQLCDNATMRCPYLGIPAIKSGAGKSRHHKFTLFSCSRQLRKKTIEYRIGDDQRIPVSRGLSGT